MKKRVIEMKKTESSSCKQAIYSKRKLGLVKKAQQLSVLCDAKVSLIMFSATGKLTEYTSPNTTTKMIFDEYQQVSGGNLWETHYQALEDELKKEMEINSKLHREYNQMIGEDLEDLSVWELGKLKQHLEKSRKIVSETKFNKLTRETGTYNKMVKKLEKIQNDILHEMEYEENTEEANALGNLGVEGGDHMFMDMDAYHLRDLHVA